MGNLFTKNRDLKKEDEERKSTLRARVLSAASKPEYPAVQEASKPTGFEYGSGGSADRHSFAAVVNQPSREAQADMSSDRKAAQADDVESNNSASNSTDAPPSKSTDSELKRTETRLSNYEEQIKALPPEDKAYFETKLNDAKQLLENKEGELERRELVEMLAHAVTQLGAGLYGAKTGTDLSGLKFNKQDFAKKYDRALNKYKLNLDTIKEERQTQDQERRFQSQRKDQALDRLTRAVQYRRGEERARDQLNETIRHNKAMENAALVKAEAKGDPQAVSKLQSRVDKLTKGVVDIYRNDKLDEDDKAAMAQTLMANAGLDISPEDAKQAVTEPGWLWGRNNKNPADAMSAFSALIQNRAYTSYLGDGQEKIGGAAPTPQSTTTERQTSDGRVAVFDAQTKQFIKYKGE